MQRFSDFNKISVVLVLFLTYFSH